MVHTFHGFPFHEFQSRARRCAYVGIERYLGRRTDVFLAVGGAVAAEAVRRGIAAPERVRVINPAIDWPGAQGSAAVRDAARRRLGVPVGCKIVGTVGRVDYQKAPESFVDAIVALDRPDVYAVWIGDGPLRREMEQRADRRGLQGRFVCVGHRDDVPQLLPGLDVFAMASRYEGLPCAVAEAMMAGLPVVATAVNAVPDVVLPGETGLLATPERPHQLAAAIRYMLDSPADAARMAAAERRLITDRFSREHWPRYWTPPTEAASAALLVHGGTSPSPGPPDDPGGPHGCHAHGPGCPQQGQPGSPGVRRRADPAAEGALADLRVTVGGADLAAPPVVLPDFHHKSNMELPSSVAVATRASVRPTLTRASVNCGMALIALNSPRPAHRQGINEFYQARPRALPYPPGMSTELSARDVLGCARDGGAFAAERFGTGTSILERVDEELGRLDLDRYDGADRLQRELPGLVLQLARLRFGMVGPTNHFVELQEVEEVFDPDTAARLGVAAGQMTLQYHAAAGCFRGGRRDIQAAGSTTRSRSGRPCRW